MKRILAWAAAIAVVLAVSGLFVDGRFREWKARAERADSLAQVLLARADTAERAAQVAGVRADSLAGVATRYELVARARLRVVRRQPVPPPCTTIVSKRDEIIDTLLASVDSLNHAYVERGRAIGLLTGALADAWMAADTLRAVLRDVPSPRPGWMPTIGAGPFVGLCTDGRPCAGAGVSLQWKVRLPWP